MTLPRRHLASFLLLGFAYAQAPAKRVILILGAPGSGKTTQAEELKAALGLPVISMTDTLNRERKGQSGVDPKAQAQVTGDESVSDEVANALMRKRLLQKDCERGFIVDGYPFTVKQAEYFETLLSDLGLPSPTVIHLSIPDSEADLRLSKRGRAEDSPANTERRIVEYRRRAELLMLRYPNAITVNGAQSPDVVAARIREALRY